MAAPASSLQNNPVLISIDNPNCNEENWYLIFKDHRKVDNTALRVLSELKNGFELVFYGGSAFPGTRLDNEQMREFKPAQLAKELNSKWASCAKEDLSPVVFCGSQKARDLLNAYAPDGKRYVHFLKGKSLSTRENAIEKGCRSLKRGHAELQRISYTPITELSFGDLICLLDALGVWMLIHSAQPVVSTSEAPVRSNQSCTVLEFLRGLQKQNIRASFAKASSLGGVSFDADRLPDFVEAMNDAFRAFIEESDEDASARILDILRRGFGIVLGNLNPEAEEGRLLARYLHAPSLQDIPHSVFSLLLKKMGVGMELPHAKVPADASSSSSSSSSSRSFRFGGPVEGNQSNTVFEFLTRLRAQNARASFVKANSSEDVFFDADRLPNFVEAMNGAFSSFIEEGTEDASARILEILDRGFGIVLRKLSLEAQNANRAAEEEGCFLVRYEHAPSLEAIPHPVFLHLLKRMGVGMELSQEEV